MEFCKFCGNILNDAGRCPWEDSPQTAIIDAMAEAEKEAEGKQSEEKGA